MASLSVADDSTDLEIFLTLSLEELMAIRIDIDSIRTKPVQQQPSSVTIITQQQIERSGARYLMDLLKLVPGFWVATDVQTTLSVTYRGIWGTEAKILLLVDGVMMNELAFGNLVLGNRYPASTIQQVEIIRGAGAVNYGGHAALAVVKVITKGADTSGTSLTVSSDVTDDGFYNQSYTFRHSDAINPDSTVRYSLLASFGQGDVSNKDWTGLDGYRINLKDHSNAEPLNLNMALMGESFDLRLIYDRFEQEDNLLLGDSGLVISPFEKLTEPLQLSFESFYLKLDKQWRPSDKWQLDATVSLHDESPWVTEQQEEAIAKRKASRTSADIVARYFLSRQSAVSLGASFYREKIRIFEHPIIDINTHYDGNSSVSQRDYAIYSQYEADTPWVNITVGARFEDHDYSGEQFVSRISLTKSIDKFYTKIIYDRAFKVLPFESVAGATEAGASITDTEKTSHYEWELGYQFSDQLLVSSNFYQMKVTDFIGWEPSILSSITLGDVTTEGMELMLSWNSGELLIDASYSLFQIADTDISANTVMADDNAILGIPNHMLKISGSYLFDQLRSINIAGTVISSRYACVDNPAFVCGIPQKLDREIDINIFYRHHDWNWSYNIGVANLLDDDTFYVQPYRGGQSPIPGLGRRLMLDIGYQF